MTQMALAAHSHILSYMTNLRELILNVDIVSEYCVLGNMRRLQTIKIYSCGQYTDTIQLAHCMKRSLSSVVTFVSSGINFNSETQMFLVHFLKNVKCMELFDCEPLCADDMFYVKNKLIMLKDVHVEMNMNVEDWARVFNTLCGALRFHTNMIDKIPSRMLNHSRLAYRQILF